MGLLLLWIPPVRQQVLRSAGLAKLPEKKFLAVLPFRVIGDDAASHTFADGLMEILPSRLSLLEQFHGALSVVPAVEVRERGITSVSKAQAAFGVTLVVSGSVRREANRVQLILNLIDARTLKQLWSSVNDYALTNALALQDGVVLVLAKMLELEMRPEIEQLLAKRRTTVPAAYDFYTQARVYLSRFENVKNIDAAIGLFEQSIGQDSNYTLAYAGLGEAYWRKYQVTKDPQWVAKAVANCQRAQELNGDLVEVAITLGLIKTGTGKNQEAIDITDAYFKGFPNMNFPYDARTLPHINIYIRAGALDKAKEHIRILAQVSKDYMDFFDSLDEDDLKAGFNLDYRLTTSAINEILKVSKNLKDDAFAADMEKLLGEYKVDTPEIPNK